MHYDHDRVLAAGLYKYVYNNEVIYIGMSKKSIFTRIDAHNREEKFKPYLNKCEIFVHIMNDVENSNLIKMYETGLIDQYCPILNSTEKPSKPYGTDFEAVLNINFQPLEKAKEEYYKITDTASIDKDTKKTVRKLSNIDKKISKMQDVVGKNERAYNSFLIVMNRIKEGNYTVIERGGEKYKEFAVPHIHNIGTGGIDKKILRVNNLSGVSFEIRHNRTEEGVIFCIVADDFPRNDSLTPFLENIQISKDYLHELCREKEIIMSNLEAS